ncbi:MAG: monovalent cation/H+ antiporter complex subunit F [Planctomycetota bacterium]
MNPVLIASVLVLIGLALVLIRTLRGPGVFDRILGVNMIGTKAVILLCLLGFLEDRGGFLDIALLYALINFVGTIAILKFVEFRRLGA